MEDAILNRIFALECWSDPPEQRHRRRGCVSDEHYIPSLLALMKLENQTACYAVTTYSEASAFGRQRVFTEEDVSFSVAALWHNLVLAPGFSSFLP
jgi:hypothetical protein